MKTGLQVFSWIAIVLGALALIEGMATYGSADAFNSLLGGALFGVEGVLALLYIHDVDKLATPKA